MHAILAEWVADALTRAGLPGVSAIEPLVAEASHRHFYRITAGAQTLVVMDSPPDKELNDQFRIVQRLFSRHDVPVPQILAEDERGFFLLTDLGDTHFEDRYAAGAADHCLQIAVDQLINIQTLEDAAIPPYTEARFRDELGIFTEWFVERLLGAKAMAGFTTVGDLLVDNALAQPQCCIHRDYHCRNLLLSDDDELGIVDFQDALVGPATYDLASLLWDCYHRFDEPTVRRWQSYYEGHCRFDFGAYDLARMVDLMALQRQLKAVGIFARLYLRDGKTTHLLSIPPVMATMTTNAGSYPETIALAEWLSDMAEPAARQIAKAMS